jgi:curved DNA-binding protein
VLGDPAKRKKYDELGANWRMYEQQAGAGGAGPQGGAWTVDFGGGQGGYRTMTPEEMREMFGENDPFSDFFHTFFGGAMGGGARRARGGERARAARQGRDVEHELPLSLEDAFQGTTRRLAIGHDGDSRSVDVRSPAGVRDGSRVRVGGEGEHGTGGAQSGDLYLRIRLLPHPRFEVKGKDLYTKVKVSVTTAVLGGEAEVTTLGGKTLRLKVPGGTDNGQVFRLKGHGLPATGTGETGDLYAAVEVDVPKDLTPEQRRHFEALRTLGT